MGMTITLLDARGSMRQLKRDGRTVPYAWMEKEIVRRINIFYELNPHTRTAKWVSLLTYFTCTRIASDQGSDRFQAPCKLFQKYTGLSDRTVRRAIDVLVSIPVMERVQTTGRVSNEYELFNADDLPYPVPANPVPGTRLNPVPGTRLDDPSLVETTTYSTERGPIQPGTWDQVKPSVSLYRERNIKEKEKKSFSFRKFWELYPKKEAPARAEKAWSLLPAKTQELIVEILPDYIFPENYDYIPLPANWLRDRRWEDKQIKRNPKWTPGDPHRREKTPEEKQRDQDLEDLTKEQFYNKYPDRIMLKSMEKDRARMTPEEFKNEWQTAYKDKARRGK